MGGQDEVTSGQWNGSIATLSSTELFQHALQRALRDSLFTINDVEAFEPRLLLTLPRLALLYGVHESDLPILNLPSPSEPENFAGHAALEVFLPRLCRPLSPATLQSIRRMSSQEALTLARRLCLVEDPRAEKTGTVAGPEQSADLFKAIAVEADGPSTAGRHSRLMRKVIKLQLSEMGQDSEAEDEVLIAKSMLLTSGLVRQA